MLHKYQPIMAVMRLATWLALVTSLALVGGIAGCAMPEAVSVKYGTSKLYSVAEMDQAIEAIKADFSALAGCTLYTLKYAGDERCKQELECANRDRSPNELYTDCLVFDSVFRSPRSGGDAWEPNKLYYWSWILAKTKNGAWTVINKGYC